MCLNALGCVESGVCKLELRPGFPLTNAPQPRTGHKTCTTTSASKIMWWVKLSLGLIRSPAGVEHIRFRGSTWADQPQSQSKQVGFESLPTFLEWFGGQSGVLRYPISTSYGPDRGANLTHREFDLPHYD